METLIFDNTAELKRNIQLLQEKLMIHIHLNGKKVVIEGDAYKEYEAMRVLEAVQLGFSVKKALLLLDENFTFVRLNIKQLTNRRDLDVVRGRVIGSEGKTKKTLENVADCFIEVHDNDVAIIGDADNIEETKTAITNLIKGTKEANVYNFLERMNAEKKKRGMLYDKTRLHERVSEDESEELDESEEELDESEEELDESEEELDESEEELDESEEESK
jgi:ribosomal RNA assembly protein